MAKISQREARSLKKRVAELEGILNKQKERWSAEWPVGVQLDTIDVSPAEWHIVSTARKLNHAVVVVTGEFPKLKVFGCLLPK